MPPRILTIDSFPVRQVSQALFRRVTGGYDREDEEKPEAFTGPLTGSDPYKKGERMPPAPPEAALILDRKFPYFLALRERYDADYGHNELDINVRKRKRALANTLTGRCCLVLVEDGMFKDMYRLPKDGKLVWNWINRTKVRFIRAGLKNDFKIRSDKIWTAAALKKHAGLGHDLHQILTRQLATPTP